MKIKVKKSKPLIVNRILWYKDGESPVSMLVNGSKEEFQFIAQARKRALQLGRTITVKMK